MNTIKIKHGSGDPSGKLQPYELGFCDDDGMLYIGLSENKALSLMSGYLPLSGGTIEGDLLVNGIINSPQSINTINMGDNGYSGVAIGSDGIYIYGGIFNGEETWRKGIHYIRDIHSDEEVFLGSMTMIGTNNNVDYISFGKGSDNWLKIIPNKGIQTDSIILTPYNEETGKGSYGYENPNDAGVSGVEGQLYFVITGD